MPDARANGAARLMLYVSLGAFALLCLVILGFELYAPWLVRMAYEQALIPPLNRLISDRSYPLSHFQRYAPLVFYKGLTLPVLLTLGAVLVSWGYLHHDALAQGLAPLRAYTARLPRAYQWTIAALLGGFLPPKLLITTGQPFRLPHGRCIAPPKGSALARLANDLDVHWPCPDVRYSSAAVDRMARNLRRSRKLKAARAKLDRIQDSRPWKVAVTLQRILGGLRLRQE